MLVVTTTNCREKSNTATRGTDTRARPNEAVTGVVFTEPLRLKKQGYTQARGATCTRTTTPTTWGSFMSETNNQLADRNCRKLRGLKQLRPTA